MNRLINHVGDVNRHAHIESYASERKKIVRRSVLDLAMKRLFHCASKNQNENVCAKLEKDKVISLKILWVHSWSLNETRDALSNSPFMHLPNEIILYIFRFLSVPDLCKASLVCRSFKIIADQDELWKAKFNITDGLHAKSYKHMYIEWMNEKILWDKRLREMDSFLTLSACIILVDRSVFPRRIFKPRYVPVGGFKQHPNSTEKLAITLSVDIDQTAPQLFSLLKKASQFQEPWQESIVLKQMIQRYYRFMQLKATNQSNILLIPTLDIEIVWQTHLLRPNMYRNDCLRLFRRIIDRSLIIDNNINQAFKDEAFFDTCQLYERRFGENYCPIEENDNAASNSQEIYSDYENPFSFTESDILLDGKWLDQCQKFISDAYKKQSIWSRLFHKSKEINFEPETLRRLKKSYERFLYMAAKYPFAEGNEFIPPTYAIDIIWHSHMQELLNYEVDCLRLVGYIIYHDPWPIIEDKNMKKSCDQVNQIWKKEFHRNINTDHCDP